MKFRALVMATLAATLPVAAVVTAPAAAASDCTYPPTATPYGLRISPAQYGNPTIITHGSAITISVRVVKGALLCGNKNVYLFVHGRGEFAGGRATYHLSKTGTTSDNGVNEGLVSWTYDNQQTDFRYYAYLEGTGGALNSQRGLVQVRG